MIDTYLALLLHQNRQLKIPVWEFWNIPFIIYLILAGLIYPGKVGIQLLIEVIETPELAFFIGTLPTSNFYYGIWLIFVIVSIMPLIIVAYGMYLGVECVTRDVAEKTYDYSFSMPISRVKLLLIRTLGAVIQLIITLALCAVSTIIGAMLINEVIDADIVIKLYIAIGILGCWGMALGIFVGSIFFDRGTGYQLIFVYIGFSFILTFLINAILTTSPHSRIAKYLGYLNIQSYLKSYDILFRNQFSLEPLYSVLLATLIAFISGLIIFRQRNIVETNYRFFNPLKWRKQTKNVSEKTAGHQYSRILVSWSTRFQQKYPFFTDELWAHGLFLLLYSTVVVLSVSMQVPLYPGKEGTLELLESFKTTPIYFLITRNYPVESKPYLAFLTANLFAFLWLFLVPYVVFRFIRIETRDSIDNQYGELLWAKPVNESHIFRQRCAAVIVEYYIIIGLTALAFIIPETLLGQTETTIIECVALILSGPVFIAIGIIVSLCIAYIPRHGVQVALGFVFMSIILYYLGSINPYLHFLALISPIYYHDAIKIMYYGLDFADLISFGIFITIIALGIYIRTKKHH